MLIMVFFVFLLFWLKVVWNEGVSNCNLYVIEYIRLRCGSYMPDSVLNQVEILINGFAYLAYCELGDFV